MEDPTTKRAKTGDPRGAPAAGDLDAELMRQLAEGSEQALRMIVQKWKNPLVNFIYASTRDFQLSEDIAIATFQKLYAARATYAPTAKFSTFLFKIARNETISEFRKNQLRPFEPTDFDGLAIPAPDDHSAKSGDVREAFENALRRLPEKQRAAISLLVQEELSYAEIADIMGESVAAVKTLINRARAFLREEMKEFA